RYRSLAAVFSCGVAVGGRAAGSSPLRTPTIASTTSGRSWSCSLIRRLLVWPPRPAAGQQGGSLPGARSTAAGPPPARESRLTAHRLPGSLAEHREDSPSGLWRSLGKRVGGNPSGVRISHPPQSRRRFPAGSSLKRYRRGAGVATMV